MSDLGEGVLEFVSVIKPHFPIRHASPEVERQWLMSLQRELRSFLPSVLKEAAHSIVRTRTHKSFPLPSECIAACKLADERLAMQRRAGDLPAFLAPPVDHEWTGERVAKAYTLCHSDLGRQAVRERWVWCLWNFCRINQRPPDVLEIPTLRRVAAEHRELVAQLQARKVLELPKVKGTMFVKLGDCNKAFADWGVAMLVRGQELASQVLGENHVPR